MVIGVPYSRVSSADQASGLGLDRQAADPAAYCSQRGWTLYEGPGYSDAGVSAFAGKNLHDGALGRFLADAKAGRFGTEPIALLIEDLDRFSRAMPLAVLPVLIDDLLNAGMTISVMSKGRDLSRESVKANPMELHEVLFWLGASHEFSQRLSRRISHVHQIKRDRIRDGQPVTPGNAPAWIDLDANGQWVLNDYAAVIRRAVAMASEGLGCHVIASTLNAEGLPCPGQYRREQWAVHAKRRSTDTYKPVKWSGASVKQLLCSPALIGDRQIVTPGYKQQIREWQERCAQLRRQGTNESDLPKYPARTHEAPQRGYYPALITESEQALILTAMQRRKPAAMGQVSQVRWVAAGLSYCACGEPIGANCSRRGEQKTYYLRCKAKSKGTVCKRAGVRVQEAQAALLARLSSGSFLAMLDEQGGSERANALATAITEQAKAQGAVDQINAALAAGEQAMANETDPTVLGVLAKRQAAQQQALEAARGVLRTAQAAVQQLEANPGAKALAADAQEQIRDLLAKFIRQTDEVADRRTVQHHLQRLGLKVHLDGGDKKRLGLQMGDGLIDWQPLDGQAASVALAVQAGDHHGPAQFTQDADGNVVASFPETGVRGMLVRGKSSL